MLSFKDIFFSEKNKEMPLISFILNKKSLNIPIKGKSQAVT